MKRKSAFLVFVLMASFAAASAQESTSTATQLIAVVNRADWCTVCRANGDRFAAVLMPYATRGVSIYINDLSNDSTTATSAAELQKQHIYQAVYAGRRKAAGRLLQSCGLVKPKTQSFIASGLVSFIDPVTHNQLQQTSIAVTNDAMKAIIDNLLKKQHD